MADYAYFYNSQNGDRIYDADSFSDWLKKFFTTGVFQGDLQVLAGEGMGIRVGSGYVNVEGKVRLFDAETSLVIENAHSTYNRIDTVVAERNDTNRNITLKVVKGGYATMPTPIAPVRENGVYQLVLAEVYVAAGATSISQTVITDKRSDETVCGYVYSPVDEFDYGQFATQFNAWFEEVRGQLDQDQAGHLQNEINAINGLIENALSLEEISAGTAEELEGQLPSANAVKALNNNLSALGECDILATIESQSQPVGNITISNPISNYNFIVVELGATVSDKDVWSITETIPVGLFKTMQNYNTISTRDSSNYAIGIKYVNETTISLVYWGVNYKPYIKKIYGIK